MASGGGAISDGYGMDWPALMRAGLRGLGLHPQEFWRLTPAELMMMLGSEEQQVPLSRSRLEDLSRLYPDTFDK